MSKRKKRHNNKSADVNNSDNHSNKQPPILIKSLSITYYASALNQSHGLLLVCGAKSNRRGRITPISTNINIYIYTFDGYLVTYFPSKHTFYTTSTVCVFFDNTAIILMVDVVAKYLASFRDFSNDLKWVQGTVFDCDEKGDIYLAETKTVSVLSSDFQFKRYFDLNLSEHGKIYTLLVKEYLIVVFLKYPLIPGNDTTVLHGCQMYRYCLETDELLQRWELSDRYDYRMLNNANFVDKYMNVLMSCDGSKGYCVWDKDGRISFHQIMHQDTHPKYFDTSVGCSLTEDNQLIYVLSGGCIKIFNI